MSDGLISTHPENRSDIPEFQPLNLEETAATFLWIQDQPLKEKLLRVGVPRGYKMYWVVDPERGRQFRVYGHPRFADFNYSGSPYLSINDFLPHLEWIFKSNTRCACNLCSSSLETEASTKNASATKPTPPKASSTSNVPKPSAVSTRKPPSRKSEAPPNSAPARPPIEVIDLDSEPKSNMIPHRFAQGPRLSLDKSAENIFKGAEYENFDLVWIPVALFPSRQTAAACFAKFALAMEELNDGFAYWPAIIHDVMVAPFQELWYTPLCIYTEKGNVVVGTSQKFQYVTDTSIRYAYQVSLLNFGDLKINISEDEIKSFILFSPPKHWFSLTDHEFGLMRNHTCPAILSFFKAHTVANERATGLYVILRPENNVLSHELNLVVMGPEIFKIGDFARVKPKFASLTNFFEIIGIDFNASTGHVVFRGYFVSHVPTTNFNNSSFYNLVNDAEFSNVVHDPRFHTFTNQTEKYVLCEFKRVHADIKYLNSSAFLGRFYKKMSKLSSQLSISIEDKVKIIY